MAVKGELSSQPDIQFQDFFLKNFVQSIDDATAMQLFAKDIRHELVHIYMSDAYLQNFLKQAEVKDLSGIKKYISDNGNKVFVNDELRIFVNHGVEQFHISSIDFENKTSVVYSDQKIYDISHFAVKIIAYISCFPDCLTDGAPHGIKTENNHRLVTSEKVVDAMESEGGIVNPHFRRGYFNRLESDFYKNKKGQIIFVHETVVNAQSKVLEHK